MIFTYTNYGILNETWQSLFEYFHVKLKSRPFLFIIPDTDPLLNEYLSKFDMQSMHYSKFIQLLKKSTKKLKLLLNLSSIVFVFFNITTQQLQILLLNEMFHKHTDYRFTDEINSEVLMESNSNNSETGENDLYYCCNFINLTNISLISKSSKTLLIIDSERKFIYDEFFKHFVPFPLTIHLSGSDSSISNSQHYLSALPEKPPTINYISNANTIDLINSEEILFYIYRPDSLMWHTNVFEMKKFLQKIYQNTNRMRMGSTEKKC
jgi:hypothetical protein